jgi:hypothetical protein
VRHEGAVLREEAEEPRAARAAVGPEGDGVRGGVSLRLHHPVVQVLGPVHLEVAGELVEVKVQILRAWEYYRIYKIYSLTLYVYFHIKYLFNINYNLTLTNSTYENDI